LSDTCPEGIAITNLARPYTAIAPPIAALDTPKVSAYRGKDGTITPKPNWFTNIKIHIQIRTWRSKVMLNYNLKKLSLR
jgi:hypothetical protein